MYSFILSVGSAVFFAMMTGLVIALSTQTKPPDVAMLHSVAMLTGICTIISLLAALGFAGDLDKRKQEKE